jgi:paraquat-inducible protein B
MNNRIILSIAIACLLTAAACNDNTADKPRTDAFSEKPLTREDSLDKEVMDGHDTAMGKMNRVRRYLVQIKKEQDSLAKLPAKQQNAQYQQMLTGLEKDLNAAEQGMNNWMEAYNVDSAKDNKELRIKYLESEKEKVNSLKKLVLESVQRADSLLKKP